MFPKIEYTQQPRWKFWMARIFGKRIRTREAMTVCISYEWRDHIYIWSIYEHDHGMGGWH